MIAQNLAHQALLAGHTRPLHHRQRHAQRPRRPGLPPPPSRRLRHYAAPALLVVDEVGYLSYDNRHADLLFEVVTRRYQQRSIVVTTNKAFAEWNEVFPNAACVVALIDRLVHHAEIITIEGESYRLKEAKERAAQKAKTRKARRPHDAP